MDAKPDRWITLCREDLKTASQSLRTLDVFASADALDMYGHPPGIRLTEDARMTCVAATSIVFSLCAPDRKSLASKIDALRDTGHHWIHHRMKQAIILEWNTLINETRSFHGANIREPGNGPVYDKLYDLSWPDVFREESNVLWTPKFAENLVSHDKILPFLGFCGDHKVDVSEPPRVGVGDSLSSAMIDILDNIRTDTRVLMWQHLARLTIRETETMVGHCGDFIQAEQDGRRDASQIALECLDALQQQQDALRYDADDVAAAEDRLRESSSMVLATLDQIATASAQSKRNSVRTAIRSSWLRLHPLLSMCGTFCSATELKWDRVFDMGPGQVDGSAAAREEMARLTDTLRDQVRIAAEASLGMGGEDPASATRSVQEFVLGWTSKRIQLQGDVEIQKTSADAQATKVVLTQFCAGCTPGKLVVRFQLTGLVQTEVNSAWKGWAVERGIKRTADQIPVAGARLLDICAGQGMNAIRPLVENHKRYVPQGLDPGKLCQTNAADALIWICKATVFASAGIAVHDCMGR